MAVTVTSIPVGTTGAQLRYRLSYDGVAGTGTGATIPNAGGPTPDLLTDSVQGPLRDILNTPVVDSIASRVLFFDNANMEVRALKRLASLPEDPSIPPAVTTEELAGRAQITIAGPGGLLPWIMDLLIQFQWSQIGYPPGH